MKFDETPIKGAWLITLEPISDQRGFFARTYCAREFEFHGIDVRFVQCNVSFNQSKGTLRGLHYQAPPVSDPKLIRCTSGAIFDVIVDMRRDSETYLEFFAVELTASNRRALYVPDHCAHGFQTLADHTEVIYQMGEFYSPGCERGLRFNDPAIGVEWPLAVTTISEKDASWPLLGTE